MKLTTLAALLAAGLTCGSASATTSASASLAGLTFSVTSLVYSTQTVVIPGGSIQITYPSGTSTTTYNLADFMSTYQATVYETAGRSDSHLSLSYGAMGNYSAISDNAYATASVTDATAGDIGYSTISSIAVADAVAGSYADAHADNSIFFSVVMPANTWLSVNGTLSTSVVIDDALSHIAFDSTVSINQSSAQSSGYSYGDGSYRSQYSSNGGTSLNESFAFSFTQASSSTVATTQYIYLGTSASVLDHNPDTSGGNTSTVPEPGNAAFLLAGLGAIGLVARRRKSA